MALILLVIGGLFVAAGVGLMYAPAGLVVLGLLMGALALDMLRDVVEADAPVVHLVADDEADSGA